MDSEIKKCNEIQRESRSRNTENWEVTFVNKVARTPELQWLWVPNWKKQQTLNMLQLPASLSLSFPSARNGLSSLFSCHVLSVSTRTELLVSSSTNPLRDFPGAFAMLCFSTSPPDCSHVHIWARSLQFKPTKVCFFVLVWFFPQSQI